MKDSSKIIRFHYAEKLLSAAEIYIYTYKKRVEWFPIVGEKLLYKKWLHLNFNNDFHQHVNKRTLKKSVSSRRKE